MGYEPFLASCEEVVQLPGVQSRVRDRTMVALACQSTLRERPGPA